MLRSRWPLSLLLIAVLAHGPALSQEEWIFVPPSPVGGEGGAVRGVEGTSLNDVWAVGAWFSPSGEKLSLIQHFDGTSWTMLPTPDTGVIGKNESMRSVVAVSTDNAVAVGSHTPVGFAPQPLAMEWNGSEWALIATPVFEGGANFDGIDRAPSGDLWVAGYLYGTAFLARRNGGGWDIEYAPQVGGERNNFNALHARTDTEIWAAGTWSDHQGQRRLLIQRFDGGGNWTTFDLPPPDGFDDYYETDRVTGVHAFAANDVWAIGYYYDRASTLTLPLIMHYDGVSWTKVSLPLNPGSGHLEGLTAIGPDDIYAAGTFTPTGGVQGPYMLHYDGVSWAEVSLPSSGGSYEWLLGMTATPDGSVWAVGQYFNGTSSEAMAFRKGGTATGIDEIPKASHSMLSSFPNPFRHETSVSFFLDRPGPVRLRVWDVSGRLVRTLAEREMAAGSQRVHWDGLDSDGRPAPSGVYFYDLNFRGNEMARQKVIRLR